MTLLTIDADVSRSATGSSNKRPKGLIDVEQVGAHVMFFDSFAQIVSDPFSIHRELCELDVTL